MPAPLTPDVLPAANPDASAPYEFRQEIARGGMGSILEAADCKLGRTVAVKVMLSEMEGDEDHKQRFINEASVLATLEHPNIVPIHDLGRDAEGQLYYTMKLVKGRTLQAILNGVRDGEADVVRQFTLDRLLTVFRKVCDALAFAHSRQIIHRDLKPKNIMVGEFGEVLVMDWGLAKALNGSSRREEALQSKFSLPAESQSESPAPAGSAATGGALAETLVSDSSEAKRKAALRRLAAGGGSADSGITLEGEIMGTPHYMSPEQAEGRIAEMDARSDIFSLGGILYTLLTLRPPVEGGTLEEVLSKVISGTITPLNAATTSRSSERSIATDSRHSVPPALGAVTMKALSVKREARYQNVAALSADVEAYQTGFATSAEQASAWKLFTLFLKRHKAASIGIVAVLLVGATLGTKAILEGRRAERGEALAKGEANRANTALADLKKSAPAMLALAESEAVAQHFESALEKTEAALRLDPDLVDAYWRRAWGLVAVGKFTDAAPALRVAGERDPAHARQLGAILPQIEEIAAVPDEAGRYTPDLLTPVFEFMEVHGARGEAGALIQHLLLTNAQRFAIAKERLMALVPVTEENQPASDLVGMMKGMVKGVLFGKNYQVAGLSQISSGLIELNFVEAKLKTLDQVRGIPCDILNAKNANIQSLEPLRGLHLSKLYLGGNRISDLLPLRGMALVELDLSFGGSTFSDLSPLAGMPLRKLRLVACMGAVDTSPLHGMPLEELDLDATSVSDQDPLAGLPLRRLSTAATVRDLRSLAGMPLETLDLSGAFVLTDLSPLAGLTLKELNILGCPKLKDLTPLLHIPTLERLVTDAQPDMLAPLRQHPKLTLINYQQKGYRPAAEVWAELDAQMAAGKK